MQIGKIDKQVLNLINGSKIIRKVNLGPKEYKYMNEACYKLSEIMGMPTDKLQQITKGADVNKFTFLKTMVNKFNYQKSHDVADNSEHILNIYSMVEKPTATHLNIVRKSKDSFEELEKIFSLAKDKETLQFVEDLQYGELKNSSKASKIVVNLLNSKNLDRFIANSDRYSSYIELHADDANAVEKLDKLIDSGKFSRFRSDAKLAIRKLFKKQRVDAAMSGKSKELENMYTEERADFLTTVVKNFISPKNSPKEETKSVIVNMYGSLDSANAKLRQAIVDRFKNAPVKDRTAEIVEMQTLFNKIDKDKDAKNFVEKAINKDLKIASIAELNEVLDVAPLKKANVFFNNAKRIIERSSGEERKTALVAELENPFFESKAPKTGKTRMIRMFETREPQDSFFTRTAKIIENKINQYRYSRMSA